MTFDRREEDRKRAEQDRQELERIYAATPADWMFIAAGVIACVGLIALIVVAYQWAKG